jgi:hypothetical protein
VYFYTKFNFNLMKKRTLLLIIIALSTITAFAQNVPSYVPSNGLLGWWPFNGNANDESGNGNHGTVNGATLSTDRFGNSTMAYSFDYTHWSWGAGGDKISIPYNVTLAPTNITVSIWAKRSSEGYPNQGMTLINRYEQGYSNPNGQTWGIGLPPSPNTTINTSVIQASPSNNQAVLTNIGPFLGLNNWTHVVMTFDGTTLKQFINGLFTSTVPANGFTLNTAGTSGISIGVSNQANGHWSPFDGSLDDIGIWNRALTACEIQDLYHAQLYSASMNISAGANQSICAGENITLSGTGGTNYQWNNNVVDGQAFTPSQSANYVLNGTDSLGCQGTDTMVVTVLENAVSTLTQTALDSYTLNGQTYTQSGTYTQTVPAANGCDSTITLNLTLNFTGMDELGTGAKKLVKITDLNGKIIPRRKNTLMLFIYEDGTVERVVEMEE